jgi:hypothetical protein
MGAQSYRNIGWLAMRSQSGNERIIIMRWIFSSSVFFAGVCVLTSGCEAKAKDIYVSASAKGGKGSKTSPLSSFKTAVKRVQSGGTVHLAAGTYMASVTLRGKKLTILGGYDKSFAKRDPTQVESVLKGDGNDAVITIDKRAKLTLDGVVITGGGGGKLFAPDAIHGGGLACRASHLTIRNCTIEDNTALRNPAKKLDRLGGGVHGNDCHTTIERSIIRKNKAKRGGGVALIGGSTKIDSSVFEDNIAIDDHGGGIYTAGADIKITRCLISGNEVGRKISYGWGGGIVVFGKQSRALIAKCALTKNYAASAGSGIFLDDESKTKVDNVLVYKNQCSPEGGVGILVDGLKAGHGTTAQITRSTMADNHCDTQFGGNAVRAFESTTVHVSHSVAWGNKDDVSHDKSSKVLVKNAIVQEKVSGDGVVHDAPSFADAAAGDYRVKVKIAGKAVGVDWSLAQLKTWVGPAPDSKKLPPMMISGAASAADPGGSAGGSERRGVTSSQSPTSQPVASRTQDRSSCSLATDSSQKATSFWPLALLFFGLACRFERRC